MSPKTLLIAAAALAASAAAAVPALSDTSTAGTAMTPPTAGAPPPPDRPLPFRAQILFNLVDTNADGSIDPTELAAFQKAVFNAIDANHDGKLSPDEFQRIAGGLEGGPGMRPGAQGRPLARFMHHQWGPGRPGGPGGPGMNGGPMRQGMNDDQGRGGPQLGQNQDDQQPGIGGQQPQDFASLDKNGDGVLTPDEFSAPGLLPAPPAPAPQQ